MASTSINKPSKVVIYVININENCRYIWFKGKFLNRLDTFDYIHSRNPNKRSSLSSFLYLHCNLINHEYLTTITMIIIGHVIYHYEDKICTRAHVRIKKIWRQMQISKWISEGWCALCNIYVTKHLCHCRFYIYTWLFSNILYKDLLKNFKKISHESFAMTTFSTIVVGVRSYYKSANNECFC